VALAAVEAAEADALVPDADAAVGLAGLGALERRVDEDGEVGARLVNGRAELGRGRVGRRVDEARERAVLVARDFVGRAAQVRVVVAIDVLARPQVEAARQLEVRVVALDVDLRGEKDVSDIISRPDCPSMPLICFDARSSLLEISTSGYVFTSKRAVP
jgi:hypothetical protein